MTVKVGMRCTVVYRNLVVCSFNILGNVFTPCSAFGLIQLCDCGLSRLPYIFICTFTVRLNHQANLPLPWPHVHFLVSDYTFCTCTLTCHENQAVN